MNERCERPSAVSLFSGAGGLDIGLERAGFRVVAAVDSDGDCIETLLSNQRKRLQIPGTQDFYLDSTRILHRDISTLKGVDLLPEKASRRRTPDLLVGGPPCQPFSSAGKQLSVHDPRGRLFEHFVRIADELRPRLILFENVRGLVTARGPNGVHGEALALVKEAFEAIGYATSFRLLNAADFGVPQRRVRMFMLASRNAPLPVFPEPTHSETASRSLFDSTKPWMTLRQLLSTLDCPLLDEDIVRPSATLARALEGVPAGSGLKSPGAREATRPGGHWGYKQGTFVADLDNAARTVTAASTQDWIQTADGLRRLTWRECAALQGFPPEWEFSGPKASVFKQVGNAVPIKFGEVLGQALIDACGRATERKAESAPLPDEFVAAIEYSRKEHARNGESRQRARELAKSGAASLGLIKGLGSAELAY